MSRYYVRMRKGNTARRVDAVAVRLAIHDRCGSIIESHNGTPAGGAQRVVQPHYLRTSACLPAIRSPRFCIDGMFFGLVPATRLVTASARKAAALCTCHGRPQRERSRVFESAAESAPLRRCSSARGEDALKPHANCSTAPSTNLNRHQIHVF